MIESLVVFDLETGSLAESAPITQLAAVAVSKGRELECFERLLQFNPDECDTEALTLQGYDEERWAREAVDPLQAYEEFSQFLRRYATVQKTARESGKTYYVARLCGHNAIGFDFPRLQAKVREAGGLFMPWDFNVLDTLALARWYFALADGPQPASFKLEDLCTFWDVKVEGAMHGALTDCRATALVARCMASKIRGGLHHESRASNGQ